MSAVRRLFPVLGVLAAAVLAAPGAAAEPVVGKPAPAFQAKDAEGRTLNLAQFRGKPVVLEWTNQGCPFVQHAYKSGVMPGLQRRAAQEGVVWLTVISSAPGKQGYLEPSAVPAWKAQAGASPAHVLLDPSGAVGRTYGAKTTPHMFVVDATGKLVYMGGLDDKPSTDPADAKTAHNYVLAALDDVKAGKPVKDAVTRPYGCAVKY
jgi:peroxiredoxin